MAQTFYSAMADAERSGFRSCGTGGKALQDVSDVRLSQWRTCAKQKCSG